MDKVAGKGLSENDYTTAEKTKLADLADIKTIGANLTLTQATGELSATDTTYSNFTGTDGTAAGTAGLVPAPATTDAGKFLKADGTWDTAGGSSMPLYTAIGQNTDGPMTQKAVTDTLFADGATAKQIKIGFNAESDESQTIAVGFMSKAKGMNAISIGGESEAGASTTYYCTAVGNRAKATTTGSVAIGDGATATSQPRSVALGSYAVATRKGEVNVGLGTNNVGFASSKYRVIGGVYDGQDDHDVATVGQWKTSLTIASTAPATPIDGELILYTGAVDTTFTASPAIYVYSASTTSWTHLTLQ